MDQASCPLEDLEAALGVQPAAPAGGEPQSRASTHPLTHRGLTHDLNGGILPLKSHIFRLVVRSDVKSSHGKNEDLDEKQPSGLRLLRTLVPIRNHLMSSHGSPPPGEGARAAKFPGGLVLERTSSSGAAQADGVTALTATIKHHQVETKAGWAA
ncbi:hypothetical protein D4764_16G0010650, partial [Takifugu flavidus]